VSEAAALARFGDQEVFHGLKVLLAHTPQMRRDYYGERSLNGLRAVVEVKLHEGVDALDARGLVDAARDVEIIVADRLTQGPGEIFPRLPNCAPSCAARSIYATSMSRRLPLQGCW